MAGLNLTGIEDKVAVVTGAGRMKSIGRSIAVELAKAGADVVITGTGRPPERYPDDEKAAGWRDIASVAEEIEAAGRRALPLVSDAADEGSVRNLLDRTVEEFGRVDFLVNNAGAARGPDRVPVVDMPIDAWDTVLRVNLRGPFLMSKVFGQHLIEAGNGGVIINISSIAGKVLGPNMAAYVASKSGLQGLTASMAQEIGRHGCARQRHLPRPRRYLPHGRRVRTIPTSTSAPRASPSAAPVWAKISAGRPSTSAAIRARGSRASPSTSVAATPSRTSPTHRRSDATYRA